MSGARVMRRAETIRRAGAPRVQGKGSAPNPTLECLSPANNLPPHGAYTAGAPNELFRLNDLPLRQADKTPDRAMDAYTSLRIAVDVHAKQAYAGTRME